MSRTVRSRRKFAAVGAALAGLVVAVSAPLASSPAHAATDPFYAYSGAKSLDSYAPGAVLNTRTVAVHIGGIALPLKAVQILYRSTGQLGQATANVTSVILPPWRFGAPKVVSYESFYDSLNPEDGPSRAIAGGQLSIGSAISQMETGIVSPLLLAGYTVVTTDTEGQAADFADGPEYGMNSLDGLRAAEHVASTGIPTSAPIGIIGYSGGAIGGGWAASMAATYAPEIASHIVGTAIGGVLVDPAHNLHYVDGSLIWAGVFPMAIIGAARAFHTPMTPYLNAKGLRAYNNMQTAPISQVLGEYPGLSWSQVALPQYPTAESIPVFVDDVNHLIMGRDTTPNAPMFIGQAANGVLEGTPGNKPGIGPGDGVMVAGDVRTMAKTWCDRGVTIDYQQYDQLSHTTAVPSWALSAVPWLLDRFAGKPAPQNCASIAPGNPLTPIPVPAGS
jgi:hypothetical protein